MPELAQKYTLTWKVTPDLLGILNTSGKFENTNPAWFKTLGLLPEEIESRQFFEFVHPDDMRRTLAAFKKVKSGRPVLGFENRYRHKDGHFRWLSWNAVPEGGAVLLQRPRYYRAQGSGRSASGDGARRPPSGTVHRRPGPRPAQSAGRDCLGDPDPAAGRTH